jgi:hydrogenase/urease accessory protein HupE
VFGRLVAADAKLSIGVTAILALVLGGLRGYLGGYEMAVAGLGTVGLIGAMVSVFVLLSLASAFVISLQAAWTRIAVRVAGSWVVAVGVLMLGWTFRG